MCPIDLQQPLRRRNRRLRLHLLAQQRLGDGAGTISHPLALGGQPGVEGRVDAVQVLQQVAVQQGQRRRLVGGRPHDLLHIHPDHSGTQRQVIARHHQDLGPGRGERFEKAMYLLTERSTSLFLRTTAPQQFRQSATQRGTRRSQGDHREQRAGLAAGRQQFSLVTSRLPSGRSAAARTTWPACTRRRHVGRRVGVKC